MSTSLTISKTYDGPRRAVIQASARAVDNSAPDDLVLATLVDVSAMTPPAESVRVTHITGEVQGGTVELYWAAVPPVRFAVLTGNALRFDYSNTGPLRAPADSSSDILLSTSGFTPGSTFMIQIELLKRVV